MENNDIVIINLDKPRELRMTNRVLKRFCAKYKIRLDELENALQRFDMMTDMIYEMLKLEDPGLTPEACEDLLDLVSIDVLLEKTSEALTAAFASGKTEADPL